MNPDWMKRNRAMQDQEAQGQGFVLVAREPIPGSHPVKKRVTGFYNFKPSENSSGGYTPIIATTMVGAHIFPTREHADNVRDGDERLRTFTAEPAEQHLQR